MGNSSTYPDIQHGDACDNKSNNLEANVFYISLNLFCLMISSCLFISVTAMCTQSNALDKEGCVLDELKNVTVCNSNIVTHANQLMGGGGGGGGQ